jgi:cytochrome b561
MLILLRVVWRFTHGAPPLPDHIAGWQRMAAKISHYAMYACMVIMPVSGYLGSSFTKYPIKYFGYTLPHWGWDAPAYKEICSQVHYITVIIFMILIAMHFAAAVKHMMARDGVIQRITRWG